MTRQLTDNMRAASALLASDGGPATAKLMDEAAATLERLEHELAATVAERDRAQHDCAAAHDVIDKLRAALSGMDAAVPEPGKCNAPLARGLLHFTVPPASGSVP